MAGDFFANIMESERTALISEYRLSLQPPFAAGADMATVRDHPMDARKLHPVNIEALGDGSFIQVCPSLGYRSLWTNVENDGYRDSYRRYLATLGPGAPALPSNLHVDHLYNRERAREFELTFVRMILLPGGINSSHGAGYEKARTYGVGRKGRPRSVDTVMLMKLYGFRAPPGNGTVTPEIRTFSAKLAPLVGATPSDLEREVAGLLDVARFRPA